MTTRSLLVLATACSVRILLECFLVSRQVLIWLSFINVCLVSGQIKYIHQHKCYEKLPVTHDNFNLRYLQIPKKISFAPSFSVIVNRHIHTKSTLQLLSQRQPSGIVALAFHFLRLCFLSSLIRHFLTILTWLINLRLICNTCSKHI